MKSNYIKFVSQQNHPLPNFSSKAWQLSTQPKIFGLYISFTNTDHTMILCQNVSLTFHSSYVDMYAWIIKRQKVDFPESIVWYVFGKENLQAKKVYWYCSLITLSLTSFRDSWGRWLTLRLFLAGGVSPSRDGCSRINAVAGEEETVEGFHCITPGFQMRCRK